MKDWYKILELSSTEGGVTDSQVKEAYYRLAKLHHPDANKASSPEALAANKERFALISQAYENLKTIDARRAYRFETQADTNWQHSKRGHRESAGGGGNAYQDVQMEFDAAERKWRQANHKTHDRSMKFMRSFERAVHPKMLFFIIPCGVLIYYGMSTAVKFVYNSIQDFNPAIEEGPVASRPKVRMKKDRAHSPPDAAAMGKAAIEAAESETERGVHRVKVWVNPATGKYELPAPWNKSFDSAKTLYVPRELVGAPATKRGQ
jgi:hypothetical protein